MGKIGGFLEYERIDNNKIPENERVKNFNEFYCYQSTEQRRCQAARCMDCGVPFCQSGMSLSGMVVGCPLHNLIPEWNDALYLRQDEHALSRLLKTNPFPEFTGRVCPALCEKACINGQDSDPVTVHDNELYIIETGYESGYMKPRVPKLRSGKKVAVIGSGPAGLAVADTLNHRGHSVTVYERDDHIGGLLMYGIPNMKLDKSVIDRRQKLMEAEGVVFKVGHDVGRDVDISEICNQFDAVVLCGGAKEPRALDAKGIDGVKGVRYAVDFLGEVTSHLIDGSLDKAVAKQVRGKNVVVVGGGDTGNDCIGTAIRLGAKSVTALEMMPKPPIERTSDNPWPEWPKTLRTDYGHSEAIAVYGDDPRVYETTVKEVHSDADQITSVVTVKVKFDKGKLEYVKGSELEIPCDVLLIAAGFIGAQDYLPRAAGVSMGNRHTVATSAPDKYATDVSGVFTAGDMHRGQSLVVWAIAEGRACAGEVDAYLTGYSPLV